MAFEDLGRDAGGYVEGMAKGVSVGPGIAGGCPAIEGGWAGIPYTGGATGAVGCPAATTAGKATLGWAGTPDTGGITGVAGGAGIPNTRGCTGAAAGGCEGDENNLVYSLGPCCTGAGGGGAGPAGRPDGDAGELNSFVYSPGPESGGGGGTGATGATGLAPEKTPVAPPESTGCGDTGGCGTCGVLAPEPGEPNKRVKAP